jgi:hypothetical protein
MMQFVLRFFCSLNTRLKHKNDMLTLEALTLFDPRAKAKERIAAMRSEYLNHLLTRSGVAENASRDIRSGCVVWYTNPPAFNEIDKLEQHGINAADIGKLKSGGICTVMAVLMW